MDRGQHPFGPLFGTLFQAAYVTNDVVRAMAEFSSAYGIQRFLGPNPFELRSGGQSMKIKTALAFVGPTMVELIEPDGGADGLYRDFLPKNDFAIRHHHYASLVENDAQWTDLVQRIENSKRRVVLDGDMSGVRFMYIDTLKHLGHYME